MQPHVDHATFKIAEYHVDGLSLYTLAALCAISAPTLGLARHMVMYNAAQHETHLQASCS